MPFVVGALLLVLAIAALLVATILRGEAFAVCSFRAVQGVRL